ncbi:hypothetical protein CJD36_009210 [Flavipsychrobacter stenotrophus]|uniref:DNA 3'-5' helicase II n=1 Tax=Flavipsychrobacter stenotrophus TaxID=2077091 RepID=A0A2S7SYD6_9BACT|nr:UvrD-helicase domain-containing protein [Flavipsychrobacter stenotrophus]PQJ11960.1 hypothetical protein CJD36_009210 [Flavipsychrobacter stenotrophus]
MNTSFSPSKYQADIFNWISHEKGNAIVNAVAGAGKTTTLVEASKSINSNKLFFAAFNKHIVQNLKKKLPDSVICKTIHAIGFNCLLRKFNNTKPKVNENKYRALCREAAKKVHEQLKVQFDNKLATWNKGGNVDEDFPDEPPSAEEVQSQLEKLINLSRCTLADIDSTEDMNDLVSHFSIDCPVPLENILYIVKFILDTGEEVARDSQEVDYTDMLWLTYKWKLKVETYDWIFVDEAQDLNAVQLHLILKMSNDGTRFLFVGDPQQAIYGFSGADSRSFSKIKEDTNAHEFPLSICYRCPKTVVSLAKLIVPTIEENPQAIDGEVIDITELDIIAVLRERDLVLCRSTEPLVRLCFKLLSKKIQAVIKGKDIGKSLVSIIEEMEKLDNFSFNTFLDFANQYQEEKVRKLKQKPDTEKQIVNITDQVASIATCYVSFKCNTVQEFKKELTNLFSDEEAAVTLCTIHRAKGLEQDRVFILYYEQLPLKWEGQKDWQLEQEINLQYVAITRAKQQLYLVSEVAD